MTHSIERFGRRGRRVLVAVVGGAVVGSVVAIGATSAPAARPLAAPVTPPASAETAKQTAEAQKLLAGLRKAGLTAEQRQQIVDQVLALGPDAARRLAVQAGQDFDAKANAYVPKFEKAAADALLAKVKQQGGTAKVTAEVETLRKTILDVSRGDNLTKEKIKQTADPALARLTELLTVSRDDVLSAIPDLKARRAEVMELAAAYHKALPQVPEDQRKGVPTLPAADVIDTTITRREEQAAFLATPMSKADRDVLTANVSLAAALDPEEARGILVLNRIRIRVGIGAQAIDPKLCEAARGHSKDMVEKKFFDHASPVPGKETPWKRAALAGTSANAENIAAGGKTGDDAIKIWWYSPGHHKNMMGGGHRVGLGRERDHFTQMFG